MTSHLETTADCADERMKQLKIAFGEMLDAPETETVFFGGDLNLRDREVGHFSSFCTKVTH